MASGLRARRWLDAITLILYCEQGKNQLIKMVSNNKAFRPPLSGEILGKLVEALQIRTDVLTSKTANRLFRGKRIRENRRFGILESTASVLVNNGVIPKIETLNSHDMPLTKILSFVFAFQADRWDRLVGYMRGSSYPVTRQDLAPVPYLRFLVIDLALRITAIIRLAELPNLENETPFWAEESDSGKLLKEFQDRCGPKRLTREQLAELLDVSNNTIDSWLDGKSRPSEDSILLISEVLANYLPETKEALRAKLSRNYMLSTLCDMLTGQIGRKTVVSLVNTLMRFTNDLLDGFKQFSKLPPDRAFGANVALLMFGTQFTSAEYLLRYLWRKETDPVWREDLQTAQVNWHKRLQLDAQYLGSIEEGVKLAKEKFGISDTITNELTEELISSLQGIQPHKPIDNLDGKTLIRIKGDAEFSARNRIIQAMQARAAGDDDTAIIHFQRAVELQPLNAEYHFQLGAILGHTGQVEESIQECWIASQLAPKWDLPRVEVGIILVNSGQHEEGLKQLEETATVLGKIGSHLALSLGYARMKCDNPSGALEMFDIVLNDKPDHALALDCAAHCNFLSGNDKKGRELAKKAHQLGASDTYRDWRVGKYRNLSN